jgi:hypothetical protein
MAKLRVQPFEDIGDPAILLNTDQDGIRIFQSAVRSAHESGEATFEFDGIKHQVLREDGAADIELGPQTVVWRFDDAKLLELLDLMVPMVNSNKPGHQYFDDLKSPVELLVLSHDEYEGPLAYGEFAQLYPESPSPELQKSTASTVGGRRALAASQGSAQDSRAQPRTWTRRL